MKHYVHLKLGGETYEFVTLYRALGHDHPEAGRVLGGPDLGSRYPDHQRPAIEPDRDDWSIELPAVIWLMDLVRDGVVAAEYVRELLITMSSPPGGCCWACESLEETESDVIERCRRERDEWLVWWSSVTPRSHPYAVTGSSIHHWDCRTLGEPVPPPVITSKHDYLKNRRAFSPYRRDAFKRVTVEEARSWRLRRCKICSPELPAAWRDGTSDVPSTY